VAADAKSSPCRVVVLISGNGSNLQALLDGANSGSSGYQLVAAISNKADVFGLERAKRAGIDRAVIDHRQYPSREAFDQVLADTIQGYNPDLVILAGFMRILSAGFVQRFRGKLINIHPSLLPKYPGLNTHQRALDAGDTEAGCSVHYVTEELDGGPTILQTQVPIEADDDAATLAARVLVAEHSIYPLATNWFSQGRTTLDDGGVLLDGVLLPPQGQQLECDLAS
jgi:phosphoribosylglycinamide formyltransferase-1